MTVDVLERQKRRKKNTSDLSKCTVCGQYVGSAVVVVGNKTDLVDLSASAAAETTTRGSLLGCDDACRQRIVTEIEATR